jgi:hypothetical protein
MSINIGALGDKRLFEDLILPSWLSGLLAVTVSILLIGLTVVLTHFGNTVQQSILGLRHVYTQSSIGTKAITVSDNFAGNSALNNVLLFLLWGSIGLMVYSIVQAILTEVKRASNVVQELNYINADRRSILRESLVRETIKLIAFIFFWLLFRYAIFKLAPYTIAVAHTLAIHPTYISAWLRSIYAATLCTLTLHLLTVLLRTTLLRPRIFGVDIKE